MDITKFPVIVSNIVVQELDCFENYTISSSFRRQAAPYSFNYLRVLSPTYFPVSKDGIDSVVGKRGLFMYRIASLILLQRLKRNMSGDSRNFNNMETRAIKFFFLARQGAEGNSCHSDGNIRGTCTIVCHRQKLGGLVETWRFFHL